MKRKRHSPEEIVRRLREADVLLAEGKTITDIAKQFGVSEPDVKRLKELERYGSGVPISPPLDAESFESSQLSPS